MDFFKRFFNIPNNHEHFSDERPHDQVNASPNRTYNVYSDPIQMQQYFEQQINEMLKAFGFHEFGNETEFGESFSFNSNLPFLEEGTQLNEASPEALRKQFLKSGYEKSTQRPSDKIDRDVDGKINVKDLDKVFDKESSLVHPNALVDVPKSSGNFFFGQSQTMKTIKNPDGSVETHHTIKDNEGNEQTTVCQKIGDKEYCIIKKRDREGREEIIENLKNMTEQEKNMFLNKNPTVGMNNGYHRDSLFDLFFK